MLMKKVLKRSNLTPIPFYPKEIIESPWGDRIQLPLRINRNTSKRSNFIRDLETFDPERYDPNPISPYWKKLNLFLMNGLINGLEM